MFMSLPTTSLASSQVNETTNETVDCVNATNNETVCLSSATLLNETVSYARYRLSVTSRAPICMSQMVGERRRLC